MADPFAAADRVARGIATAADREWLQAGIAIWQRAGGALSLERALGLAGRKRGVLARRDELLAELRDIVGGPEHMLRAIARFTACEWPRWQGLAIAPAGADYRERVLFDLMSTGAPIPTTARGLRMRLRNEIPGNRSPSPADAAAPSRHLQRKDDHATNLGSTRTARPAATGREHHREGTA